MARTWFSLEQACLPAQTGECNPSPDFSGLALGGSAATNYTLTNATGSVTITPVTPACSGLTASQSITYGGASITLGGTLSAPGPLSPASGRRSPSP